MVEKLLMYERIKKSLNRHRGDTDLAHRELAEFGVTKDYIVEVRRKMPKELRSLPEDARIYVAENSFWMIYDGVQQRKQILQDMMSALYRREQILVCSHCSTEIEGEPGKVFDIGMCPKCNKAVHRTKRDRLDILQEKRAILKQDAEEDERAEHYASKLFSIKNPKVEVLHQLPNQTIPLAGALPLLQGEDKEIAEAISLMKPMDRQMMMQMLLDKIMALKEDLKQEDIKE